MKIVIDLQPLQTESRNRGIGRYSLALARAMIAGGEKHEFSIVLNQAIPQTVDQVKELFTDLLPRESIQLFHTPVAAYGLEADELRLHQAAEMVREYFLTQLRPDFVHVSSLFEGLDGNIISINRFAPIPTATTLYDLIPYFHQEMYLTNPLLKSHYLRQLDHLRRSDLLLAISENTRQEAIDALSLPAERVINISTDADACFQRREPDEKNIRILKERYAISRKIVMYTGGIDYRKNIEGLIEAYAGLPAEIRAEHQLVICCKVQDEERRRLAGLAARSGLAEDEMVLTGYVSDEDLVALYNLCELFVFPSLYEGFGLPVLEAMRCGAPVIGSNSTSIPEVIGLSEALFDPTSVSSISGKLHQTLTDDRFRQRLRDHAQIQAAKFSWKISARRALEAMEVLHERRYHTQHSRIQTVVNPTKPRLAYISPLRPEESGIADYSAELLPELSRYYEIDLITDLDKTSDPWLEANLRRLSVTEFQRRVKEYDRVLYQFGNSEFHSHMFSLLKRCPGTVVLHDFFLGNILQQMEGITPNSTVIRQALYRSHGYPALLHWRDRGAEEAIWTYPCSGEVIKAAQGLIVHSEYALRLAERFFSIRNEEYMIHIPHLRRLPAEIDRLASRRTLGLSEQIFVVCSFGILGPIKLNNSLIDAWLNSNLLGDKRYQLIFVGDGHGNPYEQSLRKMIKDAGAGDRIKITGYVSAQQYRNYLAAADVGVQLRTHSRGETSGAALDCLAYGLATVVNNNGSLAELPQDIVVKLPAQFTTGELTKALEELYRDPARREMLGRAGVDYVKKHLDPRQIAQQYHEAIESFARNHPVAVRSRLISEIVELSPRSVPEDQELAEMAESIAENSQPYGTHQLLVDISNMEHEDLKTGIQRVVRSILQQLITETPADYRVEPVYRSEGLYRYARRFMWGFLEIPDLDLGDAPVDVSPGDIFLGLDLDPDMEESAREWLRHHVQRGLKIYFVIYDLLPLILPGCFNTGVYLSYRTWLKCVAGLADGAICISRSTAHELGKWLTPHPVERMKPLNIDYFHLGADIESSNPNGGVSMADEKFIGQLAKRNSVLMVGSLEPRKGYAQTLGAFEELWRAGEDVLLIIIGKAGWKTEGLVKHLRTHPESGKHLFWFEKASDELLLKLYDDASALLMASEGEGFGLPLIEAARHGLPIIARDLPVFREVAGDHAFYFKGTSSAALIEALMTWLDLYRKGEHPRSDGIGWLTWEQSARQLKQVIFGSQWRASWDPKNGFCWHDEASLTAAVSDTMGTKGGPAVFK
jgi:glycosyltransferase involved in cell wall biosynthesis